MDGHCDVEGHSCRGLIDCRGITGLVGGDCCIEVGLVSCVFVFVEAQALEPCAGEPLICLVSTAYPPDFVLGIPPSVTSDGLDFIFEFGGAVLFFLFTGSGLYEVDPRRV